MSDPLIGETASMLFRVRVVHASGRGEVAWASERRSAFRCQGHLLSVVTVSTQNPLILGPIMSIMQSLDIRKRNHVRYVSKNDSSYTN